MHTVSRHFTVHAAGRSPCCMNRDLIGEPGVGGPRTWALSPGVGGFVGGLPVMGRPIHLVHDQEGLENETARVLLAWRLLLSQARMLLSLSQIAYRPPVARERIEESALGRACRRRKHSAKLVHGFLVPRQWGLVRAHKLVRQLGQCLATVVPDLCRVSRR